MSHFFFYFDGFPYHLCIYTFTLTIKNNSIKKQDPGGREEDLRGARLVRGGQQSDPQLRHLLHTRLRHIRLLQE